MVTQIELPADRYTRDEVTAVNATVENVEKCARNQVIFREVNEHIADLGRRWSVTGVSLFICECSDPECAESLRITPAEYEWVRADGARFVVVSGHQLPEGECVIETNDRVLVVEKVGPAATVARTSDPRHDVEKRQQVAERLR